MNRGGLKGAVCRILTLLKHKNTIICLHTFRKHVKLTYLFIWKTMLQSVILLLNMSGPARNVCVCYGLWNPPAASLPNCISAPRVASWWKTQLFNFIHHHVRSFLLVSLIWQPALASSLRRRGWWKKPSPIFWIWTAIPSSTAVNPTYSTFNQ